MPEKRPQKNDRFLNKDEENNDEGPSSPSLRLPNPEIAPDALAELVALARKVPGFDDVSERDVHDAVTVYGAEWVRLVLIQAREQCAESWGYVVVVLERWKNFRQSVPHAQGEEGDRGFEAIGQGSRYFGSGPASSQ